MSYTLTVYIAGAGAKETNASNSLAGHIFYTITNNATGDIKSYGYEPYTRGSAIGKGTVSKTDNIDYLNTITYAKSVTVSDAAGQAAIMYGESLYLRNAHGPDAAQDNLIEDALNNVPNVDPVLENSPTIYNVAGGLFSQDFLGSGTNCIGFVNGMFQYVAKTTGAKLPTSLISSTLPSQEADKVDLMLNAVGAGGSEQTQQFTTNGVTYTYNYSYSAPDQNGNSQVISDSWVGSDGSSGKDTYGPTGNFQQFSTRADGSTAVASLTNGNYSETVTANNKVTESLQATQSGYSDTNFNTDGATQNNVTINFIGGISNINVSGIGANINYSNAIVNIAQGASATINGSNQVISNNATVAFSTGNSTLSGFGNTFTTSSSASIQINSTGSNTLNLGGGKTLNLNGNATVSSGNDGTLNINQFSAFSSNPWSAYVVTYDSNNTPTITKIDESGGQLQDVSTSGGSNSADNVAATAGQNVNNTNSPTITINNNTSTTTSQTSENAVTNNVNNGALLVNGGGCVTTSNTTINGTSNVAVTEAAAIAQERPGDVSVIPNEAANEVINSYVNSVAYSTPGSTSSFATLVAATVATASSAANINTYIDPLVMDMTGNGIQTTSYNQTPVQFDVNNSGQQHLTNWIGSGTGFLCVPGANGVVTNMSQVFSQYYGGTAGTNGGPGTTPYNSGFAALAAQDANHDGIINASDAIWSQLRVWVDSNGDGVCQPSELMTMAQAGIVQINLNYTSTDLYLNGNLVTGTATFVLSNGQTRAMDDANLVSSPTGITTQTLASGAQVVTASTGTKAGTTTYVDNSSTSQTLNATTLGVNNIDAGSGNDTLVAAATGSWLVGGTGNDTFVGGAGDDVFVINSHDNPANVHGNGGRDTVIVQGSQGMTLNMAQMGVEIAEGGAGNDVFISGGNTGVYMIGGTGNDVFIGGGGTDVMVGGSSKNTFYGGSGKAEITAGPNGDTIFAAAQGSIINLGAGADTVYGAAQASDIDVGMGNATIHGGGKDTVTLNGSYADYRIVQVPNGFYIADRVPNRNGTIFVSGVTTLNFADVSGVSLTLGNPLAVPVTLRTDKNGNPLQNTAAGQAAVTYTLSAQSVLQDDLAMGAAGTLKILNPTNAVGGSVTLDANGNVLFTTTPGYQGIMSFQYEVVGSNNQPAMVLNKTTGQTAPQMATVTLASPTLPTDPTLPLEAWYLNAADVVPVWQQYTGKGVSIGQFEVAGQFATGPQVFDYNNPDLAPNVNQNWLLQQQAAGTLPTDFSSHATMVAGVMVAANNGSGAVGVAYDASLAGYCVQVQTNAAANTTTLTNLGFERNYDIANNSWGMTSDFALSGPAQSTPNTPTSMDQVLTSNAEAAAQFGRKGLGTLIVEAGGNARQSGGTAEGSVLNSNIYSIEVGAVDNPGDLSTLVLPSTPFSNPGPSLLVSAPGNDVTTVSQLVVNAGGSVFGNNIQTISGTSFATPIVSGIVALMLQANPNLGYRDVQAILALSAKQISDPNTSWQNNGAANWNGGGMHFSNDYGYGEVDALAAVRLAETWTSQSTEINQFSTSASNSASLTAKAGQTLTSTISVTSGIQIEHVVVNANITFGNLADLTLTLIAPDGTKSNLIVANTDKGTATLTSFDANLMSTADWGEQSAGTWTLQVSNKTTGQPITLENWALNLYGAASSASQTYFYTNEYATEVAANASRSVLTASTGGIDAINAADVSGNTSINLMTGKANIGGTGLTLTNPGTINNLFAGDGNDTLVANNGNDILDGGRGTNTLTGGTGQDIYVIRSRGALSAPQAGGDTIYNFNVAARQTIDLVGFTDSKGNPLSFSSLVLTQTGTDVSVTGLGTNQSLIIKNVQASSLTAAQFTFQQTFSAPLSYTQPVTQLDGSNQVYQMTGSSQIVQAGAGQDVIQAAAGASDIMIGGTGNVVMLGSTSGGNDVFEAGSGPAYMQGGSGANTFYLNGETATQTVTTAQYGTIAAEMVAGSGFNRFIMSQTTANNSVNALLSNTIASFKPGTDLIDLSQVSQATGLSQLTFNTLTVGTTQGTLVQIANDPQGRSVFLVGVTPSQLNAACFVFAAGASASTGSQNGGQVAISQGYIDSHVVGTNQGITALLNSNGQQIGQYSSVDDVLPDNLSTLVLTGSGNIAGTANNNGSTLIGNAGNDLLLGGNGNDTLEAGTGNDTLVGGAGSNTYVISAADIVNGVKDTITTNAGQLDILQLQGINAGQVKLAKSGNDLVLTVNGNNPPSSTLTLSGQFGGQGVGSIQFADETLTASQLSTLVSSATLSPVANTPTVTLGAGQSFSMSALSLFGVTVGDALTYSAKLANGTPLPSWLGFNAQTGQFSGVPTDQTTGPFSVVVTASDMTGKQASSTLNLQVNAVYLTPTVTNPLTAQAAVAGTAFSYTIPTNTFTEAIPGDKLTYSAKLANGSPLPSWLSFNPQTGQFSGTPANTSSNNLSIVVTATEMGGKSASSTMALSINNAYVAPSVVQTVPTQSLTSGTAFSYAMPGGVFVEPIAGDVLSYTATQSNGQPLPSWLTFNAATQTFSGTPTDQVSGLISVLMVATDQGGKSAATTIGFNITPTSVTPTASQTLSTQTATAGTTFSYTLPTGLFTESALGDTLTLSVQTASSTQPLPDWLHFNPQTGVLSGTPTNQQVGMVSLLITATDLFGKKVTTPLTVNVNAPVSSAQTISLSNASGLTYSASTGNYTIVGGSASDFIQAGSGNQTLIAGSGGGVLVGERNDTTSTTVFRPGSALTYMQSGFGTNIFYLEGEDSLNSTLGFKTVTANNGPSSTVSPIADITETTGSGPDLFIMDQSQAVGGLLNNMIVGFNAAKDKIDLSKIIGATNYSQLNFGNMQINGSRFLSISVKGDNLYRKVSLYNVLASQLSASNFVFAPTPIIATNANGLQTSAGAQFAWNTSALFTSVPGDTLTYSAKLANGNPLPSWLSVNSTTGIVSGTPTDQSTGALTLSVTATDAGGMSATAAVGLSVSAAYLVPVVTAALPAQTATAGTAFSYTLPVSLFAEAIPGDTLTYSATLANGAALPNWMVFNTATGQFSGTPTNQTTGAVSIKVTATDLNGLSTSTTLGLTVNAAYQAPTVTTALATQAATAGTAFSYTLPASLFAEAMPGDTLTYSATLVNGAALPSWLAFNPVTQTFSGMPTDQTTGILQLKITATDMGNLSTSTTLGLQVTPTWQAPTVAQTLPAQSAVVGTVFSYGLPAGLFNEAIAGDTLSYRVTMADGSPAPAWLSINTTTGQLSGTPTDQLTGVLSLAMTATDLGGKSATTALSLNVTGVYQAPTLLTPVADQNLKAGSAYSFTLPTSTFVEAIAGDTLMYTVTQANGQPLPSWLSFNPSTMSFSGAPTDQTIGTLQLKVTATDKGGLNASTTFAMNVLPTYQAPTVTQSLVAQQVVAGTAFTYSIPSNLFSEAVAGDALMWGATLSNGNPLPNWLSFNSTTHQFSGTAPTTPGDLSITITAADQGGKTASTTLNLQGVIELNRGGGPLSVLENSGTLTSNDEVLFGSDVATDQIWFSQSGHNLIASIIGTNDSLTIQNWYSAAADQVPEFIAGNGKVLANANINALIQAMSTFAPPALGQTTLPSAYATTLEPVIAANWH